MTGLTDRQRAVLDFIRDSITHRQRPPTLREIGAHFGIRSTNAVSDVLLALARKGAIAIDGETRRGIRVLGDSLVWLSDVRLAVRAEAEDLLAQIHAPPVGPDDPGA